MEEYENVAIKDEKSSIENSLKFVNAINNPQLEDDEILVSFEVCSLFPSTPVPQTLKNSERPLLVLELFSNWIPEKIRSD